MTISHIPESFIDPIDYEIMKEAVMDQGGHSFSNHSIKAWINKGNHTCPIAREQISIDGLKPNYSLRSAIDEWQQSEKASSDSLVNENHFFIRMLYMLYKVHEEAKVEQPKKDDYKHIGEPLVKQLIIKNAPKETASIISYLREYSCNLLFVYETACRLNQNSLADYCLLECIKEFMGWVDSILFPQSLKDRSSISSNSQKQPQNDISSINQQLDQFCSDLKVPRFQSIDRLKNELQPLYQALLARRLDAEPKTAADAKPYLLHALNFIHRPSLSQQLLIERYKHFIPELDHELKSILTTEFQMDFECFKLSIDDDSTWRYFAAKVCKCDSIAYQSSLSLKYAHLCDTFIEKPSHAKFSALYQFINQADKFKNLDPSELAQLETIYIQFCYEAWKKLPAHYFDLQNQDSYIGQVITEYLFKIMSTDWFQFVSHKPDAALTDEIWNKFIELLTNTPINADSNQSPLCEKHDILRARQILSTVVLSDNLEEVINFFSTRIATKHHQLFISLFDKSINEKSGFVLNEYQFMQDALVEFSHHMKIESSDLSFQVRQCCCDILTYSLINDKNLLKECKTNKPLYKETVEHTIAAVLAYNAPIKKMRTQLLDSIISSVNQTKIRNQLPLVKCLAGIATPDDFPRDMRQSYIVRRLTEYKGVFNENIPGPLKESFLNALIKERFGNFTVAHVQALEALYKQTSQIAWKNKIIVSLKSISSTFQEMIAGFTKTEDALKEAKEVLKRIEIQVDK